jgi:hypothetical protein
MLITVMVITITSSTPSGYHLSKFYIYAEPSDNNKEKAEDKEGKETTIDKEEQEQTKDKDKEEKTSDEKEKSETSYIDPAYRSFFPIKRIVIPEVYETLANGQSYRFNINNPNDKVQVDKTDK